MTYVKSMLAGVVASAATLAVLYAIGALIVVGLERKYNASTQPGDSYFIEWHLHFWPILIAALVTFAFGFYWQFRRSAHNFLGTQN
jgi:hypothetical protein